MKTALIVAGAILLAGTTGAAAQSALAPDLATNDECMGSSSIGGQNPFIGISIGTTWFDQSCDRLRKAKFLMDADQKKAAISLMCADDEVRRAMATAGTPCQQDVADTKPRVTISENKIPPSWYASPYSN